MGIFIILQTKKHDYQIIHLCFIFIHMPYVLTVYHDLEHQRWIYFCSLLNDLLIVNFHDIFKDLTVVEDACGAQLL